MTVTAESHQRRPARDARPASRPAGMLVPGWPPRPAAAGDVRGWSLRRWVLVVGAVVVLFAVLSVGIGSYALTRLGDARAVVITEVHPALRAVQDLSAALVSQESGVRGYSLTAREEFLAPYYEGQQAARQAVDELRLLDDSGDVGDLDRKLDAVLALAQVWHAEYATPTISQIRSSGVASSPVSQQVGKERFDAVRAELAGLQNDLTTRLDEATTSLNDAASFLKVVFISIAIGLAVLVLAVTAWLRLSITLPLSRLADEVRLVVSGDAHREVHARGPLEVVALAGDIDAMRRHILAELDALELAHRRLDEQARDLERSNRDLEQFAYVASHDLQEPLRKVSSFCQLLKRRYGGQLDERADSYIAFAVDGASRMQRLINDLLAFSRVGRLSSGMEPVDLNEAAAAALGQLEAVREELDAQITIGELPTVRGEATLLTQLLANLVGNALKFRRKDVRPEVTVSARPHGSPGDSDTPGDGWEISIEDNGIGIEPEYADKVFVIFQRLHSRDAYPGTGIGLAMAKKIVEYHGGRIWVDRDRVDGTTVRFTLPAYAGDDAGDDAGDQLTDQQADQQSDRPADEPAAEPAEGSAEEPAGQPVDQPAHEPADRATDRPDGQPTARVPAGGRPAGDPDHTTTEESRP